MPSASCPPFQRRWAAPMLADGWAAFVLGIALAGR
jgi:hypothetical protein